MFTYLLAAILQFTVPQGLQKGDIQTSIPLDINLTYPGNYHLLPGSLIQSLVQQESPLPAPFLILKESQNPPTKSNPQQQKITFELQPLKTGKTTLLLQAEFTTDTGDIVTAYAEPINFDIAPKTVETPLLPAIYNPKGEINLMEYATKVQELKQRKSPEYADNIQDILDERTIPWAEILAAILLATITAWLTFKKIVQSPRQQAAIVTRYGLMKTLRQMADERDTTPLTFYSTLERQLKSYLKVPNALTTEETMKFLTKHTTLDNDRLKQFHELLILCDRSKFWPPALETLSYSKAIQITEEILK